MMVISGIYKIQHIASGRIYIGSSVNVYDRLKRHKTDLRRNRHHSKSLQNGYNKYGEDAFVFQLIVVCAPDDLIFYEQKIADGYKANIKPFGYCSRIAVETNRGMTFESKIVKAGEKYGRLTLIERHEKQANGKKWLCRCDCGNTTIANVYAVKKGGIASCGCLLSDVLQAKIKHKAGDRYNRFTLVELKEKVRVGDCLRNMWLLRCDCGTEKVMDVNLITCGQIKSCGCLVGDKARENSTTHGLSHIKEHGAWGRMRARAKKTGTEICPEWNNFAVFLVEMGKTEEGRELLRRDRSLPFSVNNCFWGTSADLARNSSRNVHVMIAGEKYLLCDAEKFLGIHRASINQRSRGFNETYQQAADHFYKLKLSGKSTKVMIENELLTTDAACKKLGLGSASITRRVRQLGETHQQAADHFYRRHLDRQIIHIRDLKTALQQTLQQIAA